MSNKTFALIATSLAMVLGAFNGSSITIALPSIGKEFNADAIALSWMVTSFLLAMGILLIPFGRIADLIGLKKIFLWGMVLYTCACALSLLANSAPVLIALRTVQGIGGAMIAGNSTALLASIFPGRERGKVMGINVASVYLGLSFGPFLSGLLVEYFGWRSIFTVNAVGGIISILLISRITSEFHAKHEKFDFAGLALYGLGLTCVMYGFSVLPSLTGELLIPLGVLTLLGFIKWESKEKSPLLNIGMFKNNKPFTFSNIAALTNYCATFAIVFLLSLYLQYVRGLGPKTAGLILLAQPAVMAVISPIAGKLSDKIEPRKVASIGMALTFLGLVALAFLNTETPIAQIVVLLLVFGLGFALFSSPNMNAIMSSVKPGFYGIASATVHTMRTAGQMLSMGITTVLLAIIMGPVIITPGHFPAFMTSARIAFAIFAVLCFGGIFASLARGNVRGADPQNEMPGRNS